ncbi:hypothetical protein I3842_11G136500 [Carya illinoinensis]|uniref:Uncharacterized protein n=1 Tax=Carya illinoinensis TaxID=32201 RepID=A0A922DQ24_CARIL|nr:hypothetical protein I3842_11G136500 [Carya illinoinensis]
MRQAGMYSGILAGGRTRPHLMPLARIKKIMKKYGDSVNMIWRGSHRSWMVVMQRNRRTLHKEDVASAVITTDIFDFLVNLVSNSTNPTPFASIALETVLESS